MTLGIIPRSFVKIGQRLGVFQSSAPQEQQEEQEEQEQQRLSF